MQPHHEALLLLYHGIGDAGPVAAPAFTLSPSRFRDHLNIIGNAIAEQRIQPDTLVNWWHRDERTPRSSRRSLILCFDDGLCSDYETALPALLDAGLSATFFLNPARVGQPGYLDWPQIRALQAAGMSVQSHGFDHVVLSRLAPRQLETSLRNARHILQQATGTPVQFLAAPFGIWSRRVLDAALATGHRALCTSRPGLVRQPACVVARNGVRATTSARQLQAWLQGRPSAFAGQLVRDRLLWLPKQVRLLSSPRWPEARPTPQAADS